MPKQWSDEFWQSIKSFDTEEKLDLYFYRPLGFMIAKVAHELGLKPTTVTLIGMAIGVYGGYLTQFNTSLSLLTLGVVLFILGCIFDSADGQLARISGESSKIGLILDGICDNLVFGSFYIFSTWTLVPEYGMGIYLLAVIAGASHSLQCSALDFYNREYLFFGYGKTQNDDYWNPSVEEAKNSINSASTPLEKLFKQMHLTWIRQQNAISTRSTEQRLMLRKIILEGGAKAEQVMALYREHNRNVLRLWRLMGPNFHSIGMIFFAYLARFDLYIVAFDIIALNIALYILRSVQSQFDQKFFEQVSALK
jgi:hypothetical protein